MKQLPSYDFGEDDDNMIRCLDIKGQWPMFSERIGFLVLAGLHLISFRWFGSA